MPLRVAVQMDDIRGIDISGDSTFAMMLEAQSRGHELCVYDHATLSLESGRLTAVGAAVAVRDTVGDHVSLGELRDLDLARCDVVLMRQDPPFDMSYITATYLLERLHPATLVVNDPAQVRNAPEKLYCLAYQDITPPTLITRDIRRLQEFRSRYGDIIIKPLYGNGGAGVFRVSRSDENFSAMVEMFRGAFREPFIAQQYLPEVREGDKRIILVDGVVAGAINRVPQPGETRSNMHVGGRPEPTELTAHEERICARIGPDLKARSLIFAGIDVIGGLLTEINVTSPTGIREIRRLTGADIAVPLWDAIESKIAPA